MSTIKKGSNITEPRQKYHSRGGKAIRLFIEQYKRFSGKLKLSPEEKSALAFMTIPIRKERD